ncbi:hypothetical protein ACFFQF_17530 [Haladaptatus pallidirubidus]|uniref:Uncharacterized protein n=1 Tax=Haladaptatus pallidirubidus TaxID=1008152 RepID=A0AAV3URT1_9EURY|nr:hypothetical protein [Haladaptatus pallidirubidus]
MTDVNWFRDATEIVLPIGVLDEYCDELERQFMITVVGEQDTIRLIGSPVVISEVRDWLISKDIIAPKSE